VESVLRRGGETFGADLTLVGFLSGVDPHVLLQIAALREGFAAHVAREPAQARKTNQHTSLTVIRFSTVAA